MVSCKIRGCKNRSDNKNQEKLHFFSFPKDEETASKWIAVCKKSTTSTKNSRVCSSHFKLSDYKPKPAHLKDSNYSPIGVRTLLPDAVPTENIAEEDIDKSTKSKKVKSVKRERSFPIIRKSTAYSISTVMYAQLINSNQQPHIVRSTPFTAVKYVNSSPNLDVRLEQIEAPAYVLDHQYASSNDSNSEQLNMQNKINNEKKTIVFNKNNLLHTSIYTTNKFSELQEIIHLRQQLQRKLVEQQNLQKHLKRLQRESKELVNKRIRDILKSVFSPRQIDKLLNPHKTKVKWSVEDIISAISLQNISLKAYRYLRDNNHPLPGISTIQKWTARINVNEGVLVDVLTLMKYKAKSLSIFQKIAVLNFGEMYISNKNCQFCIVRGLFYKWIQPVYYSFNKRLTGDIIKNIASKLYNSGYIVVALTCNFSLVNINIWTDLNLGIDYTEQCCFKHPSNENYKIFVFPDESHLLVLIRKHFLDSGFIIAGKNVNKNCIEEIINIDKQLEGDFHKLTPEVLVDYESLEQNVLQFKKLFSKLTAQEIFSYGQEGFIHYVDWKETSEFFELISDWIVLFSSKVKEGFKEGEEPYGLCLDNQNNILSSMEELIRSINTDGSELLSFQKQVILRCVSLQQLLVYLQASFSIEDFHVKYILTNRFNSELLDSFIAYFCSENALNNKPTVLKFQNRMRKCILGKYSCDAAFEEVLKLSEPCLIDFNERSDSAISLTVVQKQKVSTSENAERTAEKVRQFLTANNISTQKVHKNLLHIMSKKT